MRTSHEIARQLAERGHELYLFRYRFDCRIRDLYHVPDESENSLDFSRYAEIHEIDDPRPVRWFLPGVRKSRLGNLVTNLHRVCDLRTFASKAAQTAALIDGTKCDAVLLHLCAFTNAPLLLNYLKTSNFWYCQEPSRNLFESVDDVLDKGKEWSARLYRRRRRSAEVSAARRAGTILCNSEFSRESIMRAYGIEAVMCRLGVDAGAFKPVATEKKSQVICWGPLWPAKGLDFIVRSVSRIPMDRRPNVVFPWTRGSESYRQELDAMARALAVVLEMPQGLNDRDLLKSIHASLVCVYAPRMEPFGLVPVEAMAAGLPVIGIREGGVRESVLHGVTGFLCDRNEEEFAERIMTIMINATMREEMAKVAAEYVRREWSWQRTGDVLEQLFVNAASNAKNITAGSGKTCLSMAQNERVEIV